MTQEELDEIRERALRYQKWGYTGSAMELDMAQVAVVLLDYIEKLREIAQPVAQAYIVPSDHGEPYCIFAEFTGEECREITMEDNAHPGHTKIRFQHGPRCPLTLARALWVEG